MQLIVCCLRLSPIVEDLCSVYVKRGYVAHMTTVRYMLLGSLSIHAAHINTCSPIHVSVLSKHFVECLYVGGGGGAHFLSKFKFFKKV